MEWRNIYRGMLMGVSDVVPGVSGGTIAVILGIYDELIAAINGVFTREWKRHLTFLVPLGIGIGAAIWAFSRVMNWLIANQPGPTFFMFIGLIVGILPFLFKESNAKSTFKWYHIVLLIIGIVLISLIKPPVEEAGIIIDKTMGTYFYLFLSGFLGSTAMILPGISGSLILVILGSYATVMESVENFEIGVILVVGIGILLGIITMSKIIHYFLSHFRTVTYSLIIGLVIGSIYVIYTTYIMPTDWTASTGQIITSVITFIVGLIVAFILGKIEH